VERGMERRETLLPTMMGIVQRRIQCEDNSVQRTRVLKMMPS